MANKIDLLFNEELAELKNTLNKKNLINSKIFKKLCQDCLKSIKKRNKIIFFGNGGSAADAQHLSTELTVRYKKNRKAIPAISLATDTSALTAIGNDFDFKYIFSRQIEAIANKGDLCLAITTSGNSQNIIEACKIAKKMGIRFFAFAGNNGGKLKKFTKNIVLIPSKTTSIIQVIEIFLGQILCNFLEDSI
jgi:D-sedoheptulose 7-phosphate isomerase